jgi:rubrerythrin
MIRMENPSFCFKTESRRVCSICGNEFAGAMEFCPVCMLRKGLADGVESSEGLR